MAESRGELGNRHLAWIAAWATPAVIFAGGTYAAWTIAAAPGSTLPAWPAYLFLALCGFCLYMVFSPVFHWPPFRRTNQEQRGHGNAQTTAQVIMNASRAGLPNHLLTQAATERHERLLRERAKKSIPWWRRWKT